MSRLFRLLFFLLFVFPFFNVSAEVENGWKLRKNNDSIKVYTKKKEDTRIYMYKVVAEISLKPEMVYRQVVDFRENLKYMELVDSLRCLDHQKDRLYRNYMHFNMPWPVENREMISEMEVTINQEGIYLESNHLPEHLPDNPNAIPIKDYKQKWTIKKGSCQNESRITVIGWVDPGGSIPPWVVNLFSVQTPFRFISGILKEVRRHQ